MTGGHSAGVFLGFGAPGERAGGSFSAENGRQPGKIGKPP